MMVPEPDADPNMYNTEKITVWPRHQLSVCVPILTTTQCQKSPNIVDVLQPLQQRDQLHQVIVCWVADPTLDRDCVV
jgi:hypothetical protein